MADGFNDFNKRLAALQNKDGNGQNISSDDLQQRLKGLQDFQKRDVDPNATQQTLNQRLNALNDNNNTNINQSYAPNVKNVNQNSKLSEHKTDALLAQIGDELTLENAINKNNQDIDFDIDDELDDIETDPALFAYLASVENDMNKNKQNHSKNANFGKLMSNAQNNAALTQNDHALINNTMNQVPDDISKYSKQKANTEYEIYRAKQKMYSKKGKHLDTDEYLDKMFGDDDDGSDGSDDSDNPNVKALISAVQDDIDLEDKFGPVQVTNNESKQNKKIDTKKQSQSKKKKKSDDDDDEVWDSYAEYDVPKKKKKKRRGFW